MNINSEVGKQYDVILTNLKLGEAIELPSIAPGLSDTPTVAVLSIIKNQQWVFDLYWHDTHIGRATAERKGETLEFKEKIK